MDLAILEESDYKNWDDFVKTAINGTIFSESLWGRASKILDPKIDFKVLAVVKDSLIYGGMLLFIKDNKIVIPRFTPYTSVVYRPINTSKNYTIISERRKINDLIADYLTKNFKKSAFKQHFEYNDIRDFQFKKFNSRYLYTFLNYLTDYNINQINNKIKRDVNKISKENYVFENPIEFDKSQLEQLLGPFFETMDKKVFSIDNEFKNKFINMVKILEKRIMLYTLRSYDNILSTRVELVDNDEKIEDWIAGTMEEGREKRIGPYFVHRILSDLKEKGYVYFDWNGANTPGVTDFKRNFGGVLKSYSQLEYFKNKYYEILYQSARILLKK